MLLFVESAHSRDSRSLRLKHALTLDETTTTPLEEVHQSLVNIVSMPPDISAPTTPAETATHISRAFPDSVIRDEARGTTMIKAKLLPVDFEKSADIWAQAGHDLTMWVLQYVQSQISSHKRKVDKLETEAPSGNHGLVGTGVSLTCAEGADKPSATVIAKEEEPAMMKTENTTVNTQSIRATAKIAPVDKVPDSAYTLLSTSGMPFPQLSIRKNFRTLVTATAENTIAPPAVSQSTEVNQNASSGNVAPPGMETEGKVPEMLQRQVNVGRYCPQVLGHEGSVRVAKSW